MIESLRVPEPDGSRWTIPFPAARVDHLFYEWPEVVDEGLAGGIVELMRHTSASSPIIGFAEEISDNDATRYLDELRANLAAGKCRLLTISTDTGELIGLCTLRRNLNPNNRHITDLAKGMIREAFRGGAVLPAAFHEIALRCEADGVDVVTLDVRSGTAAHRAWDRFGFQTWGVMPDYARAGGEVHGGHFMLQKVADLKARAAGFFESRERPRASADAPSA